MKGLSEWLKRFEPGVREPGPGGPPQNRFLRILLVLGLLGIFFLTWSQPRSSLDQTRPASALPEAEPALGPAPAGQWSDAGWARELEEILSGIRGVGRVRVMVSLETSAAKVYAGQVTREQRVVQEGEGGSRVTQDERESWQPVVVRSQDGRSEGALVEKERAPQIRGVLVVADGGDNPALRRAITQAVAAVTGLGAHRIVVLGREP